MSPSDALAWLFVLAVALSLVGFFVVFSLVVRQRLRETPDLTERTFQQIVRDLDPKDGA